MAENCDFSGYGSF